MEKPPKYTCSLCSEKGHTAYKTPRNGKKSIHEERYISCINHHMHGQLWTSDKGVEGLLGSRARPPGEPCAGPASWGAVSPPGAHGEPCAISVVWGAVYEKKQNGRVGSREHGGEVCVGSHAQKGLPPRRVGKGAKLRFTLPTHVS